MNILMLGVQGSGKGTQAKLLAKRLGIPHVSSGDIFRNLDETTEVGKKVKALMDKGDLVPDKLTFELVFQRLNKDDCKEGVILDGFPRNVNQAEELDKKMQLDHAILLDISDQEAIKRISGRRTCSNKSCGIAFNIITAPKPKKEGICDKCGSKLFQREDETEDAVKKRIKTYHEVTEPLIDFYRKKGTLVEINGEQSIEGVRAEIRQKLSIQ